MRDWLVILLIVLAGIGAGVWALRPGGRARQASPATPARDPAPAEPAPRIEAGPRRVEIAGPVTNTKVLPHPEDMPLATLEFESPIGHIALRRREAVIGRHSTDDIRIPDVRVSRHHARLVANGDGRFEIHNLTAVRSEPNPMLVNGVDREHAHIGDGDVVTLGGVSFTFRQAAA
jgi:hypothetical protein